VAKTTWHLAGALAALMLCGALATFALVGGQRTAAPAAVLPAPPPVTIVVTVPAPAPPAAKPIAPAPRRRARRPADKPRLQANATAVVAPASVASFYPLYDAAQKTFRVNWLLLASVHQQETAFSSHATTYAGLNGARCCAGPMQFNVTNGPVSTWERYRAAHRFAKRPAVYGHRTRTHPSVYDDFDSMMAAGALLRDGGATIQLDGGAWRAAYDYYGHDLTGVDYATRVLARAIGWGQKGFCAGCATDPDLVAAVDAAYAAPVRALLDPPEPKARPARVVKPSR